MQEIFEENGSKLLQGAIVWTPMLETDSLSAAEGREALYPDSRVRYYWDPERILGQMLSQTLKLRASMAWDVYLLYPPGHLWNADLPPAPQYWMHQLDEEPKLLLDPLRFKRNVQKMVEEVK